MPGFWISMATFCLCGLRQVTTFQSPHFHLRKKGLPRGPTPSQVLHYKAWLLANWEALLFQILSPRAFAAAGAGGRSTGTPP